MTPGDAPALPTKDDIERVFRAESGRAVSTLIRIFGDIDLAEDAVQDAFLLAQTAWLEGGLPPNPCGWILTTGSNRAIDWIRRESLGRSLIIDRAKDNPQAAEYRDENLDPSDDDQLRLIFTCCHPALSMEAQVGLTLRLICGLQTPEIARALLVTEAALAQRLVRAKRKIKDARIPYRVPHDRELPARQAPVLAVIYLVYNAGTEAPPGPAAGGAQMRNEGIRLARLMAALLPDQPEVIGLLALLLLNESRRSACFDGAGAQVLLRDQDRQLWSRSKIQEGQQLLRTCMERNEPGPYQIQAAIQAVHADAGSFQDTDWPQIVSLYDELLRRTASPVVALNRAIALGEVEGAGAALAIVESLSLPGYCFSHATRGDLLEKLGRFDEASAAFRQAAELAPTEAVRGVLLGCAGQADRLGRPG